MRTLDREPDGRLGTNAPNRKDDVMLVQYLSKSATTLADYPRLAGAGDCPAELRIPLKWQALKNPWRSRAQPAAGAGRAPDGVREGPPNRI